MALVPVLTDGHHLSLFLVFSVYSFTVVVLGPLILLHSFLKPSFNCIRLSENLRSILLITVSLLPMKCPVASFFICKVCFLLAIGW